jgi:DHA2 family multidrug resistance protein-like MFS transporter
VLGGVLLQHFWWGSVFLPNVAAMGLLLAIGPRTLPRSRDPSGARLDPASAVLATSAVLAGVYGITRGAERGPGLVEAGSILVGVLIAGIFVLRQRRLNEPLVDLRLFRGPAFSSALGANCVAAFVAIGIELFTAQYLQLVLGMSPFEAGLWSLPSAAGIVGGSIAAPQLTKVAPAARIVPAALLLAAGGLVLLTLAGSRSGLAAIVAGTTLIGLGVGPVGALATDLIVGAAPARAAGAASGISETGTELGGALGIAILGSIGTAVYRSEFGTKLLASGAPPQARETLGDAIAAGSHLPATLSDRVLTTAHSAFTQGLHAAALIAAGIAIVMAALNVASRQAEPQQP